MLHRPSLHFIYSTLAEMMSLRSKCERLSVGCVIASEDGSEVFSVGYNGGPKGSLRGCRGKDSPAGACGCVHAESNAIAKCRASRGERKVVYVTHMPCELCATLLVNMGGVIRVTWANDYRLRDGESILSEAGIIATKVSKEDLG